MVTARMAGRAARYAERRGKSFYPGSDLATWGARVCFGANPRPADVELVRAISAAVSPRAMAELLAHLLAFDVRAELARIALPTVVVGGTRDVVTPPRRTRGVAARIPGAQFELLAGCGHLVMLERADALDRILESFAAELAA
jgi:pimeloyl-ACP methyl ester carboxylesterase